MSGCKFLENSEEPPPPIFADTDLTNADYTDGQFNFLMVRSAQYIVLGIFNSPIGTSKKSILNMQDMEGGSASDHTGFSRSQVNKDSLYTYSFELQRFTGAPGGYTPKGTKYWAVWGFNADWVIICSSSQITTDFQ